MYHLIVINIAIFVLIARPWWSTAEAGIKDQSVENLLTFRICIIFIDAPGHTTSGYALRLLTPQCTQPLDMHCVSSHPSAHNLWICIASPHTPVHTTSGYALRLLTPQGTQPLDMHCVSSHPRAHNIWICMASLHTPVHTTILCVMHAYRWQV